MVQTIQTANVTLATLKEKFGLRLVRDSHFFPEWMSGTEPITDADKSFVCDGLSFAHDGLSVVCDS
ncbi:MAG: hypothetical protein HC878_17815 [Leptolyngbyaceae cyanobacterium SL_5_14]|nr:hypothetical protein [Leptolyngbyaceae cyanobacterium SL_5_14]